MCCLLLPRGTSIPPILGKNVYARATCTSCLRGESLLYPQPCLRREGLGGYAFPLKHPFNTHTLQVVAVADEDPAALPTLNAQMRRIDLLCKLLGPLCIALIDGYSTKLAIIVNLGMNLVSVIFEYFAIARVYDLCPALRRPKLNAQLLRSTDPSANSSQRFAYLDKAIIDFLLYIRHAAFLPSFAGALLYLTVLSFASQMVSYLLSAGYDSSQIGIARTFSVAFEVVATWTAPWLMSKMGATRAGLWTSSWQVLSLAAGTTIFVVYRDRPMLSASGLVIGTIFSRIGLRGFDLCAQLIVQEVKSNRFKIRL